MTPSRSARASGLADEVARGVRERHVEADEVGLAQDALLAGKLEAEFAFDVLGGALHVVVENAHGEAARPAGHGLPYAAHAEDTERAVMDVVAGHEVASPFLPLA